jgi:hypothetical protein
MPEKNIFMTATTCIFLSLLFAIMPWQRLPAQHKLQPGFDPQEYAMLLSLTGDVSGRSGFEDGPGQYRLVYRSEPTGLDNRFDVWLGNDQTGIIEIRGTTAKTRSWLENFYAGMVPARGSIETRQHEVFCYKLAEQRNAAVHAGWLTGLASMAPAMIGKINEYYATGTREFIIMGHSQGGAIAFLLDSYLHYDTLDLVPDDIVFKTYNSAAPKPGNLYYAYDYDFINRGGWALRVVNPIDWVPETPISVQTADDFSEVNPFRDMATFTGNMAWLGKVIIRSMFRKTWRSLDKSRDRLMKYLGFKLFNYVEQYMPGMTEPEYVNSMNYTPAGTPVILPPNDAYYREYVPTARDDVFRHHKAEAYLFLLEQNYPEKP